jgi:hypothetical protein
LNSTGPLLRRHALDLIDEALGTNDVHEIRKRLKELRAITDLLRSRLPHHGREDRIAFRNAARRLAGARDAAAALEAFDGLGTNEFAEIREVLSCRNAHSVDAEAIAAVLVAARRRVAAWPVDGMHDDDVFSAFRRSYRRARNAMAAATEAETPELFHEWRKRTKALWYEARLLSDDSANGLHKLSAVLGDHHDLAILDHLLRASPETYGDSIAVLRLLALIAERTRDLQRRAVSLGEELFLRRGPKRAERTQGAQRRASG